MDDALGNHLTELEELIHQARADGEISDDERGEIAALVERVRDDIAAEDGDGGDLADQLERAAVRFEGDHPTIANVIRSAVHTLTGFGM